MDAGISTSNSFDHLQQIDKDDRITLSELTSKKTTKESGIQLPISSIPVKTASDDLNEHNLEHSWSFWFLRRVQGAKSQDNYEKNVKKIASFSTVEGFWGYYNHMLRPNDLPITSDYHLFKDNIKPLWEDEANKYGGKWMARLRKGLASRCWEELVMAVIGEQFDVGDEVCGIVISIRFQEDIISIWNKNATNKEAKHRLYEKLRVILNIPNVPLEYKPHDQSIRDSTTFRYPPQLNPFESQSTANSSNSPTPLSTTTNTPAPSVTISSEDQLLATSSTIPPSKSVGIGGGGTTAKSQTRKQ